MPARKRRTNDEARDLPRAWREGRSATDIVRTRPATSVLSIRVSERVLKRLGERARAEGRQISIVARELIEDGLARDAPATPRELARLFSRWVEEAARLKPPKKNRRA